jgi:hypothetical protein
MCRLTVMYSWMVRAALLTPLLVAGCAVNRPPEYESAAVTAVCAAESGETVAVSFLGQTKSVTVHKIPSWEQLYSHCGKTGGACVYLATNDIYMLDDRRCLSHASHELGHVFGVPGLDIPRTYNRGRIGVGRI